MMKSAPIELDYEDHMKTLYLNTVRAVSTLTTGMDCAEEMVPNKMIRMAINTISSDHMTPEEEALGFFTRKRLKKLSTWEE